MRISDWSSDVCSSDLHRVRLRQAEQVEHGRGDVAQRAAFAQRDSRAFTNVHQRHRADGVRGVRLAGGRVAHHLQVAVVGGDHQRAAGFAHGRVHGADRSEEHTSELQSLMRISYAVFCLKKKKKQNKNRDKNIKVRNINNTKTNKTDQYTETKEITRIINTHNKVCTA